MSRGRDANHAYCITSHPAQPTPAKAAAPPPNSTAPPPGPRTRRAAAQPDQPHDAEEHARTRPGLRPRRSPGPRRQRTRPRPRPCAANCPAPTTSAFSAASGTTWPAAPRPPDSSRPCADALPADLAEQALDDPACTWLWRSLREAEAAGLDGAQVLRQAVAARPLDRRPRHRPRPGLPDPPHAPRHPAAAARSWADRVPGHGRPRIWTATCANSPRRWTTGSAGSASTPPRPGRRGPPRPSAMSPTTRPAGRTGSTAPPGRRLPGALRLRPPGRPDRPGTRQDQPRSPRRLACSARCARPGRRHRPARLHRRRAVAAPQHLRTRNRLGTPARHRRTPPACARPHRLRQRHPRRPRNPRRKGRGPGGAARHSPGSGAPWKPRPPGSQNVRRRPGTRRQWEALTETTRRIAIAADPELRRRHPGMELEPLRSAEPEGVARTATRARPHVRNVDSGSPLRWYPVGSGRMLSPSAVSRKEPMLDPAQREVAGQQALGRTRHDSA